MNKRKSAGPDVQGQNRDTRFKPGQSGNPKGRPKNSELLSKRIRAWLDEHHPDSDTEAMSRLQHLIERLYDEDPKTLLAYAYGKPVESVEVGGSQGEPVEFVVAITQEELP